MSDEGIAQRIEQLVDEEHQLRRQQQHDSVDEVALEEDQRRLRTIEVELDRCWDLLRRRRALRRVGGDPEIVEQRDADTVEHYLQ